MSPIVLKLGSEKPKEVLQLLLKCFRGCGVGRSWRGRGDEAGAPHQE